MPTFPTTGFTFAALCLVPALVSGGTDTAIFYRGEVQVATSATGKVVAVLDAATKERPQDGIADEVFILRQEPSSAVDVALLPTFAQVVFTGRSVRIVPAEGDVLLLTLDVTAGEKGSKVVDGYGLIHLTSPSFEAPAVATLGEYLTDEPRPSPIAGGGSQGLCPDGGGGVTCDAGGCGASSCEVNGCYQFPTSCGVSCQSGYFACCQCPAPSGAHCDCWDQAAYCSC